jgi:hypothetical protein
VGIGIEADAAGIGTLAFIFSDLSLVQEHSGTGLGLLVPASALLFIPVPNQKNSMKGGSSEGGV